MLSTDVTAKFDPMLDSALVADPGFQRAALAAIQHIPITEAVVKPEFRIGWILVRKTRYSGEGITFHCYSMDAWTPPRPGHEPLLRWQPPTGEKVATVDRAGYVHALEA